MSFPAEGGCLCGKIRYRVLAAPVGTNHCHCTNCRKASGAWMSTWAGFRNEDFEWVRGEPARYRYENEEFPPATERLFCADCGSNLAWRCEGRDEIVDVTAGSLDDPNLVEPEDHLFTRSKVRWLNLDDGLPQYEGRRTS